MCAAGVDPIRAWWLTPAELVDIAAAIRDERTAQAQNSLAQSWTTAALTRTKRMPKLTKLLSGTKRKHLSPAQLAKARAEHEALMEAATEDGG